VAGVLDVAVIRRTGPAGWSMDRLADALEGSRVDEGLRIRGIGPRTAQGTGQAHEWSARWHRWVCQPLELTRVAGDVFHLVDHSDAHLLRVLPAERTVVTCHDLLLLRAEAGELPYAGRRWWGARFRWTVGHLRRAGAVVCPSEATRSDVLRFCDVEPERTHVIPQGIASYFRPSTSDARMATRRRLKLGDAQVVFQVATGVFYKNVQVGPAVIASLHERGLDVVMVRVGPPLSLTDRAQAESAGLAGRIIELGAVSEPELVELYGAADALLFPSTGEGFGWPALEAMACGLPVIVSSTPALTELTGGAARRAAPDDVVGLADEVATVLTDDDVAATMRAAGLRRAGTYTWERTLRSYASIYCSLAEDSPPDCTR
jgi:glycosyltransferase involved in cell wall biosynthesis